MIIPILAVLGWLGDRRATLRLDKGDHSLEVESPLCARYGNATTLVIRVAKTSGNPDVWVEVSRDFLDRFAQVRPHPDTRTQDSEWTRIPCSLHPVGLMAVVNLEMTPEKYGWARGKVRVLADGLPAVEVSLSTFVLP